MIKVNDIPISPTMFPDGTSQMWKLPSGLFEGHFVDIKWNFESERELMDLFSLRALIHDSKEVRIHIPYLPYARQDKDITNTSTFNLRVFAALINGMNFYRVSAVDVHNPVLTGAIIKNFCNLSVKCLHEILISNIKPDYIVFPDKGAALAFLHVPYLIAEKDRKQDSGFVAGINFNPIQYNGDTNILRDKLFLVIDDICDGGATFLKVAEWFKVYVQKYDLHLFTTHGIYSKGKEPLINAGFKLYTTNSLIKNVEGFRV
jgi:ribose-phosphate pyrophosphokinase